MDDRTAAIELSRHASLLRPPLAWHQVQQVQLGNATDEIRWTLSANGVYSAKSAYIQQFITRLPLPRLLNVWRIRSESRIKFFVWTLIQNRLQTAGRLLRRGWEHQDLCCACAQVLESADHMILN